MKYEFIYIPYLDLKVVNFVTKFESVHSIESLIRIKPQALQILISSNIKLFYIKILTESDS